MSTTIIGAGGIGSAIARRLASGGETVTLLSADKKSARTLAAAIGEPTTVAVDNRSAIEGADAAMVGSAQARSLTVGA